MTSPESNVPQPEPQRGHHRSAGSGTKRSRAPWLVAGAVVLAVLGGGVFAYSQLVEDSGFTACAAIRDGQLSAKLAVDGELTEPQYQQLRTQFKNSDNKDIQGYGTRMIDTVWQIQHVEDMAGPEMKALMGPLRERATGLQSACADEDVRFDLAGLGATPPPGGSADPNGPGASSADARPGQEGSVAVSTSHAWPDGVTVYLDSAQVVDRALGRRVPKSMSLVKATCTYRNTTVERIDVTSTSGWVTLLYGSKRTEADPATGGRADGPKRLSSPDEPARIKAGGSVQMWQTFAVPNKKLAALALTVTGPAVPGSSAQREPYTFIEVEKVLKR